jgi:L-fuculose-phosphate aldolase
MGDVIKETKQLIVNYGQELFDRNLTDAAGGNLSVRIEDQILMTPRYAGNLFHWKLKPSQILTLDLEGNKLEGDGETSRETKVHVKLLNEFYPEGTAVVHAHARHVLVFCAAEKPIPPTLHATEKFGVIPLIPDEKAHSQELADAVTTGIRPQTDRLAKAAAAVLAPKHGIFLIAKDLHIGFDSVERIDTNAYCLLQRDNIPD